MKRIVLKSGIIINPPEGVVDVVMELLIEAFTKPINGDQWIEYFRDENGEIICCINLFEIAYID